MDCAKIDLQEDFYPADSHGIHLLRRYQTETGRFMETGITFTFAAIFLGAAVLSSIALYARQPIIIAYICLLYTSPSPRDRSLSRMPSSA